MGKWHTLALLCGNGEWHTLTLICENGEMAYFAIDMCESGNGILWHCYVGTGKWHTLALLCVNGEMAYCTKEEKQANSIDLFVCFVKKAAIQWMMLLQVCAYIDLGLHIVWQL